MSAQQQLEDLLSEVAKGNRRALVSLYRATSARLYGVAYFILQDEAAAQETLQEVYLTLWEEAASARPNGLLPWTWLLGLTRDHAIAILRASHHDGALPLGIALNDIPATLAQAEPGRSAEGQLFAQALAQLSPDREEAIKLSYLQGWQYEDLAHQGVADRAGMRLWLRKALSQLREALSQ